MRAIANRKSISYFARCTAADGWTLLEDDDVMAAY
jgi:hypothetical protein